MTGPSSPRTAVVFGGGGWAGSVLLDRLRRRALEVQAPRRPACDVADRDAVRALLEAARPDVVLNLAAAQPGADPHALEAVNVRGAANVARAAAAVGARLVHVSSDAVLDGRAAPYADEAPASPLTPYGRSKAEGEAHVAAAHPEATIVRTSLLWDPRALDRSTAGFAARLAAGEACRLFTDEIRCPLPRGDLAEALVDLLPLAVPGRLNVAGREALSRHAFGLLLLRHFGVQGFDRIEAVRAADLEAAGAPPRPRDLTLAVDRAEGLLGRRFPTVGEALARAG